MTKPVNDDQELSEAFDLFTDAGCYLDNPRLAVIRMLRLHDRLSGLDRVASRIHADLKLKRVWDGIFAQFVLAGHSSKKLFYWRAKKMRKNGIAMRAVRWEEIKIERAEYLDRCAEFRVSYPAYLDVMENL